MSTPFFNVVIGSHTHAHTHARTHARTHAHTHTHTHTRFGGKGNSTGIHSIKLEITTLIENKKIASYTLPGPQAETVQVHHKPYNLG